MILGGQLPGKVGSRWGQKNTVQQSTVFFCVCVRRTQHHYERERVPRLTVCGQHHYQSRTQNDVIFDKWCCTSWKWCDAMYQWCYTCGVNYISPMVRKKIFVTIVLNHCITSCRERPVCRSVITTIIWIWLGIITYLSIFMFSNLFFVSLSYLWIILFCAGGTTHRSFPTIKG